VHPKAPIVATCADDLRFYNAAVSVARPIVGKMLTSTVLEGRRGFSLSFNPEGTLLAIAQEDPNTTKGWLVVLKFPELQPVFEDQIADERVSVVKFGNRLTSPTDPTQYLAAASWDQQVYLYTVVPATDERKGSVTKHKVCRGSSTSITHVQFSHDDTFLMTNSKDGAILYWRTVDGSRIKAITSMRDVKFPRWTCVLGWPVIGIWGCGSYDLTDINCCDQAPENGKWLAMGDDEGLIHLLRYPSPFHHAPSQSYGGHSSHVTNLSWIRDQGDLLLFTVGGTEHMCQLFVLRAEENKAQVINPTRPWMNAPRPRELMRGQMEGVGFDNSRPPSAASHAPSAAPSLPLQNLRATAERRASSAGVARTYRNHSRVGDHLAWDH
jgi:WD40 repeat protein